MAEPIAAQLRELGDFLQRYRDSGVHPVLWVGAGASAAAGYPTLGQLEQRLRAQLRGVDKSGFALVDAFIEHYSEADLELELQRHIGQPRLFVQLHEAMARLAGGGVCPILFTTNYDRLIENALTAAGVAFVPQILEANFTLQSLETVQVLKLHGDCGDWERVILTAASYQEFQRTYPILQQQLNLHLRTRPVVFIGCSMRDPRLLDWLEGLSETERRRLFASRVIITTDDWQGLPDETRALLDSANVKAITVPHHDSLTHLLTQVAARLVPRAAEALVFDLTPGELDWTVVGPTADSPPHTIPNPLVDASFIALLRELRECSSRPLRLNDPTTPRVRAQLDRMTRQIGERLTHVLFSPTARAAVVRRINAIDRGRARLTIRVGQHGPHGDQALALPWELLMPEDAVFAVHDGQLDVVREAVTEGAPTLEAPTSPLTVAVTIAAPEGQTALNYEQEAFRLYAALTPHGHQVAFSDLGTVEDLINVVEGQRAVVIHFSGHGLPGKLAFENDEGFEDVVDIEAVLRQLRTRLIQPGRVHPFPRLFYLASCHGATGTAAQEDATGSPAAASVAWHTQALRSPVDHVLGSGPSTAATLHRSGFVQVVGYYGPIGDELSTQVEEAFYSALARGETTIQAAAEARAKLVEPLIIDDERLIYPLGWVQLAVYHRGPDLPLAVAGQTGTVHLLTRFKRQTIEVRGLPVLELGFIGHRPLQHEVRRRLRSGQRLIVLQGLGGLGKTALASQLLSKVLAPGQPANQLILPCAALERADGNLIDALTARVIDHGQIHGVRNWETQVQALEERQLAPVKRFEAVLLALWRALPGLIVYADNVESLQEGPATDAPHAVGAWKPEAQAWWQCLENLVRQGLMVLASTRYVWPGLAPKAWVPMNPMSRADVLRMMAAFETLDELPRQVKMQLATRVDGHPRTVEFLDSLITQRLQALGLGYNITDPWRELVEPVLPATDARISADLLLDVMWSRLTDEARAHASRLSVLRVPAPRSIVDQLGQATNELIGVSVLTRHREQELVNGEQQWTDRWGLHSIVKTFVAGKMSEAAQRDAHMAAGLAYEQWVGQTGARWSDQVEGIQHLLTVGAGDRAWPMLREYTLWLRRQGRYREALALLESSEAAGATGDRLSAALMFIVQMRSSLGDLSQSQVDMLDRALTLAETDERRSSLLHELGSLLQAQAGLPGARAKLERALEIEAIVFGTEEHPDVAASLHELAVVLQDQGDLPGARAKLERALEISAIVFGTEEHPDVAASLHELAVVLHAQGDLSGARAKLERALEIDARVYGSRDLYSTAISEMNLGFIILEQGDTSRAIELLGHAYEVFRRQLGPEHPHTQSLARLFAGGTHTP
jgi:tetratricopeptide (TPR) repeat protein